MGCGDPSCPLGFRRTGGAADYGALVDAIANALLRAVERDEAAPDVEPRRDATQAVAMADGLAWHVLCAPSALAADAAAAALDAHLDHLLPPC